MKKILLVGGAGFIGAELARVLLETGHEVHIYDAFLNFADPFDSRYDTIVRQRFDGIRKDVHIQRGDIRSSSHVYGYINRLQPDVIVHLAAIPVAKVATDLPEVVSSINVNGLLNVLEAMRTVQDCQRFVFLSSSFVYGNFRYSPADEEHPLTPIDVYGGTKVAGETLTRSCCTQYGVPYTLIRPSSVYGPGDSNKRISHLMIERALAGRPVQLHNGGESMLDFTNVRDLAIGIKLAIESVEGANNAFNLTRGRARKVSELADVIRKHIPTLETQVVPPDQSRPERGTLDITRARTLLGFDPRIDIEEGIPPMIEEIRSGRRLVPT